MEPKQKQYPVVDVTDDRSKIWCCKEQYCIGTWNVRSMNQGKLEVVKQEMARVNVDILGISKLKWTGMGEFNSDDHYIYYCGQESLRRNGVAIMVNKRVWNAVLECSFKNDWMISVCFQANHSISQLSKSMPWPVMLKNLKLNGSMKTTRPSRINTKKRCPFHYRGLECISRKPRNTWSNREIWPWSTKWSRAKANRVFPRKLTGHSKHPFPKI